MRVSWQSWLLGIAVFVGSCIVAQAQGPGAPPPPAPNAPPRRSLEALTELRWLSQQLNLTPEQREKLRPTVVDEGEQLHQVRIDERLSPDQKREKSLEIRQAFRPKIAAELTPEQKEKWQKMQEGFEAKPPQGAKDAPAAPAPPK